MPGPWAVQYLQMPHPGDWQGGQMPAVARGEGGGLGTDGIDWTDALTTWKLSHLIKTKFIEKGFKKENQHKKKKQRKILN